MQQVWITFERLIKRAVAPSVSFLVILLVQDLLCGARLLGRLAALGSQPELLESIDGLLVATTLLIFLGLSYVLTMLSEALFHGLLMHDFATWPIVPVLKKRLVNQQLRVLRDRVRKRIEEQPGLERFKDLPKVEGFRSPADPLTDRFLYELVGGIDPTGTSGFTDEAKATGVVFVSLAAVILVYPLLDGVSATTGEVLLRIALAVVALVVGRELVRAHYRSRSLRHYVNFLAMSDEAIEVVLTNFHRKFNLAGIPTSEPPPAGPP